MLRRLIGLLAASIALAAFGLASQALADSSTLVGMVSNGDIYVKAGTTTAPWTYRLTNGENATQLEMYGDRVAFVDGSNNLWLKQGLTGQWYEELGNVQSYALTETGLLALQTGGDVWYKAGQDPTAHWDSNLQASNGSKVYLSPNQMVMIDTGGNLLGKAITSAIVSPNGFGPDSQWVQITGNAASAAVTDSRFAYVDTSGKVYGKEGSIFDYWFNPNGGNLPIDSQTESVSLSGTVYCATFTSGGVNCKPYTFGDVETYVWGTTTDQFALAPGMFLAYGNDGSGSTDIYGMDYSGIVDDHTGNGYSFQTSSAGWNTVSTTGTEIVTNQE